MINGISSYRSYKSVELAHIQLVSIGAFHDDVLVENILKFDFVQTSKTAFQGFVMGYVQRKEDLNPGILSGSERICLS